MILYFTASIIAAWVWVPIVQNIENWIIFCSKTFSFSYLVKSLDSSTWGINVPNQILVISIFALALVIPFWTRIFKIWAKHLTRRCSPSNSMPDLPLYCKRSQVVLLFNAVKGDSKHLFFYSILCRTSCNCFLCRLTTMWILWECII